MTTKDATDLAEMAVSLARLPDCADKSAYTLALGVARLARLGREAATNATRLCSDESYNQDLYDRRVDSISRRAFQALADTGIAPAACKMEVHGDPRGSCLQIHVRRASGLDLSLRF